MKSKGLKYPLDNLFIYLIEKETFIKKKLRTKAEDKESSKREKIYQDKNATEFLYKSNRANLQ